MDSNNPTAIALAIQNIQDLQQKLRGNGFPRITAANDELREWLTALRDQIDDFLKR